MTQLKKTKKERKKERIAGKFWKKRQFITVFYTSVLSTAREMPKNKRKNHDKMC